ncbi:unnamed protein product [Schistosoma margrebowiei]|uniref:Leishmanolysin-like peptidase n=1 Tax=Schistosoma margrebowiei TaxID=48269 RepID=A0A183MEL8_9TREM|nr:unnamed protein product [Schistosoma margrebowiei]
MRNTSNPFATHYRQQPTMGENKPYLGGGRDQEEALKVDTTNYASRETLTWNPQGQRRRERPKNTLRREMEIDMRKMNKNWMELEKKAQDRMGWRIMVGGLRSIRSNRRKNKTIHPFCDKVNLVTCRDLYSYGICHIIKYNHEIPPEYRFFKTPPFETSYAAKYIGGDDLFKDYCPTQTVSLLYYFILNIILFHAIGSLYEFE